MTTPSYVVFSKPGCEYCERAKALLAERSISHEDVTCASMDDVRDHVGILLPEGLATFPVIVDLERRCVIGGFMQLRDRLDEPVLEHSLGRFSAFPVRYQDVYALYKKAVASFWTSDEIPMGEDASDFQKLSNDERHFVKMILAFFASSDGIVNENLMKNFSDEVQISESRLFYAYQAFAEAEHNVTYSLMIDALIKDGEERDRLLEAIVHVPSVRRKASWALKWLDPVKRSFSERLVAFACVEGILFSGSFAAIFWLKHYKKGLMPGLSLSNQFIARDEGLHVEHACTLYRHLKHKLSQGEVEVIVREAVENEKEFITEAIPCTLIGMGADSMKRYIEFVADALVADLGYKRIYSAKNPFPWMEMISMESKTNFFETRVSEYSRSGVMHKTGFSLDAEF